MIVVVWSIVCLSALPLLHNNIEQNLPVNLHEKEEPGKLATRHLYFTIGTALLIGGS